MISAPEPITVTVSHHLGRDEAKRRVDRGLGTIRAEIAPYVRSIEYGWDGYRLNFRVSALAQTIYGCLEVSDEFVRVELGLPRLLHLFAKRIATRIERRGAGLLGPPEPN
jgi:hypothetical protein